MLVAHRGGGRLAPENTMVAFQSALDDWGADMLELDVRLSRDGVVMVIHDETVDRTTDGTGRVSEFTLAEAIQPFGGPNPGELPFTIQRQADLRRSNLMTGV